jgi:hypothetical protein
VLENDEDKQIIFLNEIRENPSLALKASSYRDVDAYLKEFNLYYYFLFLF